MIIMSGININLIAFTTSSKLAAHPDERGASCGTRFAQTVLGSSYQSALFAKNFRLMRLK